MCYYLCSWKPVEPVKCTARQLLVLYILLATDSQRKIRIAYWRMFPSYILGYALIFGCIFRHELLHWTPFCSGIRHSTFRQKVKAVWMVQYILWKRRSFYVLAPRSSEVLLSVYNHMINFCIVIKEQKKMFSVNYRTSYLVWVTAQVFKAK